LKAVIASQYVASIGMDVYRSFESDEGGGHEVVPYRFDDNHVNWDKSLGAVGFPNSWGTEWGIKVDPYPERSGRQRVASLHGYFNTEGLVLNLWTQRLAA
jgi:hypothetical protein